MGGQGCDLHWVYLSWAVRLYLSSRGGPGLVSPLWVQVCMEFTVQILIAGQIVSAITCVRVVEVLADRFACDTPIGSVTTLGLGSPAPWYSQVVVGVTGLPHPRPVTPTTTGLYHGAGQPSPKIVTDLIGVSHANRSASILMPQL